MKNKRIWLVIVCILVVGVLVTRYTSSVVNREEPSQEMAAGGAEMRMTEVEAEAAPAGLRRRPLPDRPLRRFRRNAQCRTRRRLRSRRAGRPAL